MTKNCNIRRYDTERLSDSEAIGIYRPSIKMAFVA